MKRNKKIDKDTFYMLEDGKILSMNKNAYDYIIDLRTRLAKSENERYLLDRELKAIKPVLEIKNIEPATSAYCSDCKFVVRSAYNRQIIGCKKNCVCTDYQQEEE